jgi:hypothetical protein
MSPPAPRFPAHTSGRLVVRPFKPPHAVYPPSQWATSSTAAVRPFPRHEQPSCDAGDAQCRRNSGRTLRLETKQLAAP